MKDTHPAQVLQRRSLQSFANHFHWVVEDEELPDTEELIDEIANMMSCFEPNGLLPAEFKSADPRELSEASRLFRELRPIVEEHAMRYPSFYIQLQGVFSPGFQVKIFFEKINKRINDAFNALDEYIERGPTNHRTESLDVIRCARRLQGLVDKVEEYRDDSLISDAGERRDDAEIERLAAAAYIRMLEEVVTNRNCDAYADSSWAMPMPPSDPMVNNLFVRLIGPASEENGYFVLDKIISMAPHIIRHHGVDLADLENRLRSTPLTPPAYLIFLRSMIQESRKRAASQSGGNTPKRSMQ